MGVEKVVQKAVQKWIEYEEAQNKIEVQRKGRCRNPSDRIPGEQLHKEL